MMRSRIENEIRNHENKEMREEEQFFGAKSGSNGKE